MKVKMNVTTNYKGPRFIGKVYDDIPDSIANRWISRGIATSVICTLVKEEEVEKEIDIVEDKDSYEEYNKMKPSELLKICEDKGIELDEEIMKEMSNKKKKQYVISALIGEVFEAK